MNPKYSNIFWHQGVKVFEEKILTGKQGQIKVEHLENDVTKALLNLFEHCGPKVLASFLQIIGIKKSPGAFDFDFQIMDTESYRHLPNRIMLSIISTSTQIMSSANYQVNQSIPDACIYSKDTAVLIESKTQSPLIKEQIQGHIKHYLGKATREQVCGTLLTMLNNFCLFSVPTVEISATDHSPTQTFDPRIILQK